MKEAEDVILEAAGADHREVLKVRRLSQQDDHQQRRLMAPKAAASAALKVSRMRFSVWSMVSLSFSLFTLVGCADDEDVQAWAEDESTENSAIDSLEQGLSLQQLPYGTIVGACYPNPADCNTYLRAGTRRITIGDAGRAAQTGWSFVYVSEGHGIADTSRLNIPANIACGFQKNGGSFGFTCAGVNPARGCPRGFARQSTRDAGGGMWDWCSYVGTIRLVRVRGLTRVYNVVNRNDPRTCGTLRSLGRYDAGRGQGTGLLACMDW